MANTDNTEIKQHVSIAERNKWDKCVVDFYAHLGAGGVENHRLGDGTIPGFSTNDFTNEFKTKLEGIEAGALNNPHPASHSYEMITGLSVVGHTGQFKDLLNIPNTCYTAEKGNCNYINGVYFHVGATAPSEITPQNDKAVWFDVSARLIKVFHNGAWTPMGSVFL